MDQGRRGVWALIRPTRPLPPTIYCTVCAYERVNAIPPPPLASPLASPQPSRKAEAIDSIICSRCANHTTPTHPFIIELRPLNIQGSRTDCQRLPGATLPVSPDYGTHLRLLATTPSQFQIRHHTGSPLYLLLSARLVSFYLVPVQVSDPHLFIESHLHTHTDCSDESRNAESD